MECPLCRRYRPRDFGFAHFTDGCKNFLRTRVDGLKRDVHRPLDLFTIDDAAERFSTVSTESREFFRGAKGFGRQGLNLRNRSGHGKIPRRTRCMNSININTINTGRIQRTKRNRQTGEFLTPLSFSLSHESQHEWLLMATNSTRPISAFQADTKNGPRKILPESEPASDATLTSAPASTARFPSRVTALGPRLFDRCLRQSPPPPFLKSVAG